MKFITAAFDYPLHIIFYENSKGLLQDLAKYLESFRNLQPVFSSINNSASNASLLEKYLQKYLKNLAIMNSSDQLLKIDVRKRTLLSKTYL